MATSTTPQTPLDSPAPQQRRGRRLARAAAIVAVAAVLIALGSLIGLRFARAGALPGLTVDGVDLSGDSEAEVRDRLTRLATRKGEAIVVARRDDARYRGTAGTIGYAMDVDATVDQVMYRGRQGNPLTALRDHLRAFAGQVDVKPVESVDDAALTAWVEEAAATLELQPREGGLRFDGAAISDIQPRAGQVIDNDDLAAKVTEAVLAGDGGTIDAATESVEPVTDAQDVAEVRAQAERAVAKPLTLRRGTDQTTLTPDEIGEILATDATPAGTIELAVQPDALTTTLGPAAIAEFEREPTSAHFEIEGGSIQLIKGEDGFTYNADLAAEDLNEVLLASDRRSVKIAGDITKPDLSNAEARKLKIVEQVSTFTTYHACCESRVTNIHRIADLVDDVVIEPGETFSLNGHVGERTEEKGFVNGGAIFEGEFVEQIGGGVSQFATTTYNAAFFGGYSIPEHKAHSYYISRYPVGREATLNYPNVDLKIHNDSPYGMVLDTSYTDESITVSVYGKEWVEVDTTTGPRTDVTQPQTQYKENDDLRKGKQRVIQEAGSEGFDIVVTRILTFPDGETKREEILTTYLAQPRIIERNT